MNDTKFTLVPQGNDADFYKHVSDLLADARQSVKRQLDSTIVITYYEIGRMIVEREHQGQKRVQFYQVYMPTIQQSLTAKFKLSWTHYQVLMRIDDEATRRFYEIEAKNQQWSVRQLQRKLAEWV